jgi:hypothetical protein
VAMRQRIEAAGVEGRDHTYLKKVRRVLP